MITLLLTVFLVVLISAICSMTEAALYSVPWTYIENLRKQGSATGELLYQLRSRIDQPIAAVLTLNTVANTAGAAMEEYATGQGYGLDFSQGRFHHEIYLSDVRRCKPEKLKTVIRQPIIRAE